MILLRHRPAHTFHTFRSEFRRDGLCARTAPLLEIFFPWGGTSGFPLWRGWTRFEHIPPAKFWPCHQLLLGRLYFRSWREGTLLWYSTGGSLMAVEGWS